MDNSNQPKSVSGTVGWNKDKEQKRDASQPVNQQSVKGPLTGKDVTRKPAAGPKKSASAFRTISEVADELEVQQHVLRFWETKFSQIRPLKRGGGRRYYRPEDLALLKKIHHLLYTEGYTIKGVQKLFKEQGKKNILDDAPQSEAANRAEPAVKKVAGLSSAQRKLLESTLGDLKDIRKILSAE